jgi:hypothetical protein
MTGGDLEGGIIGLLKILSAERDEEPGRGSRDESPNSEPTERLSNASR